MSGQRLPVPPVPPQQIKHWIIDPPNCQSTTTKEARFIMASKIDVRFWVQHKKWQQKTEIASSQTWFKTTNIVFTNHRGANVTRYVKIYTTTSICTALHCRQPEQNQYNNHDQFHSVFLLASTDTKPQWRIHTQQKYPYVRPDLLPSLPLVCNGKTARQSFSSVDIFSLAKEEGGQPTALNMPLFRLNTGSNAFTRGRHATVALIHCSKACK